MFKRHIIYIDDLSLKRPHYEKVVSNFVKSWNKSFDEQTLKKNLINLVTGLKLKEIFEKEDLFKTIQQLKSKPYISGTTPSIKVIWDNTCEKIHQEYIDYVLALFDKHQPYNISTRIKNLFVYTCGGADIYLDITMWKRDGSYKKITLLTKEKIKKNEVSKKNIIHIKKN